MITPDLLKDVPLFTEVPATELATIAGRAADIRLHDGEWLIHEGEAPAFFILLSGRLAVSKSFGGIERVLTDYEPGSFFGELPLLLGSPAIASLRATKASRVARLDDHDFRELIVACPRLNAELMRTMATRVGYLQQAVLETPVATVTIIGHRFDLACHDLRDFLARNRVLFRWHDPRDPEARVGMPESRLVTPTFRELAERLRLDTVPAQPSYDVIIIGAGPAGLAAAVYGASEGLCTLLIEREAPGGQAGTSSRIENYLGFPTGISGDDLGTRALQQAKRFGVEIVVARDVVGIESDSDGKAVAVLLDGGGRVETRSIVIATGVAWRELEVVGADSLVGRGIYYGAARTEALNTRGRDIFLIGGGNSAGQAAMFFANYARSVTILVRGPSLVATMSHYLIAQLESKTNVNIEVLSQVVGVEGSDHLEAIVIEDRRSGERRRQPTDALFVFIGADAETSWLPPAVICDKRGYVCTGRDVTDLVAQQNGSWPLERDPYLLETSVPGIFAVGDVRHGSIKRVASGVGEGSMAIAFIHQYFSERQAAAAEIDSRSKDARPAKARAEAA